MTTNEAKNQAATFLLGYNDGLLEAIKMADGKAKNLRRAAAITPTSDGLRIAELAINVVEDIAAKLRELLPADKR